MNVFDAKRVGVEIFGRTAVFALPSRPFTHRAIYGDGNVRASHQFFGTIGAGASPIICFHSVWNGTSRSSLKRNTASTHSALHPSR